MLNELMDFTNSNQFKNCPGLKNTQQEVASFRGSNLLFLLPLTRLLFLNFRRIVLANGFCEDERNSFPKRDDPGKNRVRDLVAVYWRNQCKKTSGLARSHDFQPLPVALVPTAPPVAQRPRRDAVVGVAPVLVAQRPRSNAVVGAQN